MRRRKVPVELANVAYRVAIIASAAAKTTF
jgi:hypothetical protein